MTTEYENRCSEKNTELATALGWVFIPEDDIEPCTREWRSADGQWQDYPRWAQDSAAAFRLMLEHACFPVRTPDATIIAVATGLDAVRYAIEHIADHPSAEAALRIAVINAVLLKLSYSAELNDGVAVDLEHALKMSGTAALD